MSDESNKSADTQTQKGAGERSNFVRNMIDADLQSGKFGGRVVTRFPPEPNGYLHIGHAKSICLNFGLARDYEGGQCHLRFDDTNPDTEDVEYVESIQNDVKWLGFDWGNNLFYASDYFDAFYEYALNLIKAGKAYVDSSSEEEIRALRGTLSEPGRASAYRDRSVAENLDLFERMRSGEFEDGTHVLRAKIDLGAANMKMRDPLLYRIRHAHHYRSGDKWCIYPMYDFAHCLEDAIEKVTHSICTLEFENNRDIYDWVLDEIGFPQRPEQTEFARLNLDYTVMSKRKLLQLVEKGLVQGWDDPRMPTIAGMRRRGYRPEAIRDFCDMIGVAKSNSTVDIGKLEFAVRNDLNKEVPRVMAVIDPIKVVLTNVGEAECREITAPSYPHDVPKEGTRVLPFSRELWIERGDFMEEPPKGYYRLAPGQEVRLRYGCLIRCESVVKDAEGHVVELHCVADLDTFGKAPSDGRKVKGVIHWLSAAHARPAEVRLYDRLFSVPNPGAGDVDFVEQLNPDSYQKIENAWVEPSLAGTAGGSRFQFERLGYFVADCVDSTSDSHVFNRIVGLRDSWTKKAEKPQPEVKMAETATAPKKSERERPQKSSRAEIRARIYAENPALAASRDRYHTELGLSLEEAEILSEDGATASFYDAALSAYDNAQGVANWVIHQVLREKKDQALADMAFGPSEIAQLVKLVDDGTLTSQGAKDVFGILVEQGGDPAVIVESQGLAAVNDDEAIAGWVSQVLDAHGDEVQRFRQGEQKLFGFLMGKVMQAAQGKGDPKTIQAMLRDRLSEE